MLRLLVPVLLFFALPTVAMAQTAVRKGGVESVSVVGEDGSQLWLRFPEGDGGQVTGVEGTAMEELRAHWRGGNVVLERRKGMPKEGFRITANGGQTRITASTDVGLLYGAYYLLRLQQTGALSEDLDVTESPAYDLRILNHWDNPDGTIERGYAGHSIFWENPREEVIRQYARANASIGINGAVLNNVNAKPKTLDTDNLQQVKWLADILRPYRLAHALRWVAYCRPPR